jgi:hypothetical protein
MDIKNEDNLYPGWDDAHCASGRLVVCIYSSFSVVHVRLMLKLNSSVNPRLNVPRVKDEKSICTFGAGADLDV